MTNTPRDNLPFPKRWLGYLALKLIVLVTLLGVALKYYGLW
jgi:hypothetical protein